MKRKIFILFLWAALSSAASAQQTSMAENNPDGSQTLLKTMPAEVATSTMLYQASPSEYLDLRVQLPLRNQSQLNSLLQSLYDPQSPNYHQWLTPSQFTLQFGYSGDEIDFLDVKNYLQSQGLTVRGQSPNGTLLYVNAPVPAVEGAFKVHINHYLKKDGTSFMAPDADPTVPTLMTGKIIGIVGLDNLHKIKPHALPITTQAISSQPLGSGPDGYLAPSDIKTAYNLNGIRATGQGQTVALVEFAGYLPSDIPAYEQQFGLPQISLQNIYVDNFNGVADFTEGSEEVDIDIETINAFAPDSNVLVYEAPNDNQGWIDELNQIASDDKAPVVSVSWGVGELDAGELINSDSVAFAQMALQGQAVFVAAGDDGAYDADGLLMVDEPAAQPYVTSVGISALSTNTDGTYKSESASLYGGGGISTYQTIPAFQTPLALQASPAALVSTTMRNVPDVVLTADASTGYSFFVNGSWGGWYGSSISAPIWGSLITLADQSLGSPLGYVNPVLYNLAGTAKYSNDFHDITTGNNGYYPAEGGFDDATGLGSFNGLNLYDDLITTSQSMGVPPTPTGLTGAQDGFAIFLSWNPSQGAASYIIQRASQARGNYTTIASEDVDAFYSDTSISTGTTYFYIVSAVNAKGASAPTSQVSAEATFGPPSPPSNLTATAGDFNQVNLSWGPSQGSTSYQVERSTSSSGPFSVIASQLSSASYTDTSATNNNTFYYTVSAVNSAGTSSVSNQASVVLNYTLPAAPLGVVAAAGSQVIALDWNAVPNALSYNVKRSTTNGGPYTTIASVTLGSIYYDGTVTNGTTYYYVMSAVNFAGEGPNSAQVSATPVLQTPQAPTLTASAGNAQVSLSWSSSTGATTYNIERSTSNSGPFQLIATVAGTTSYTDSPLTNGTTYYYYVTAINASGTSPDSNVVNATPGTPPAAPSGLTATGGNEQVALSWNASAQANSYNIYRSTGSSGGYAEIATAKSTSYTDTSVSNATTYYYVVTAVDSYGESGYSNQASAMPQPPSQYEITATASAGGTITPSGQVMVNAGANISFTITPNTGYSATVTVDGNNVSLINNTYTFDNVSASHAIFVTFTISNPTYYDVVATAQRGCSISPSGDSSVLSGSNLVFTITVPGGYVPSVTDNGANVNVVPNTTGGYTYTINNVVGNHYILVNYTQSTFFTITASSGPGGTISPSGSLQVQDGAGQTFLVTPNAGYTASILVDGSPAQLTNNTYTFTDVTAAHAIAAIFTSTATTYTITASAGQGGSISPTGAVQVPSNGSQTFIITPNLGLIALIVVDGNPAQFNPGTDTYTFNNVTASHTIVASFSPTNNPNLPLAPVALVATAGEEQVSLSWTAPQSSVNYYLVERSTVSGGPYTMVASQVTGTSYTDTTAVANRNPYYYVVAAVNSNGTGPFSNEASATPSR